MTSSIVPPIIELKTDGIDAEATGLVVLSV